MLSEAAFSDLVNECEISRDIQGVRIITPPLDHLPPSWAETGFKQRFGDWDNEITIEQVYFQRVIVQKNAIFSRFFTKLIAISGF